MKTTHLLIFILIGVTYAHGTQKVAAQNAGKSKTAKPKVVAVKNKASSLTTDAKFNDQAVGGKYQLPMEALSVVENEKAIDDLIGVRKNFQDRQDRTKGMR